MNNSYPNNVYGDIKPTGKYAPISPWAYFGLSILFSIPVVGFIFLIIFSVSDANINRRNYARSYWCMLILVAVVAVIAIAIFLIAGGSLYALQDYLK